MKTENFQKIFVPDETIKLLQNKNANFSLCFSRLMEWKNAKSSIKKIEDVDEIFENAKIIKSSNGLITVKMEEKEIVIKGLDITSRGDQNKNRVRIKVTGNILKLAEKAQMYKSTLIDKNPLVNINKRLSGALNYFKNCNNYEYTVTAKLISPFVTGLGSAHPTETGIILDRNTGLPYIPASSVKGVLRLAYAINLAHENAIKNEKGQIVVPDELLSHYFGDVNVSKKGAKRGQLIILDVFPKDLPNIQVDIMNSHNSEYYSGKGKIEPLEIESLNPIKFLAVEKGCEFVFRCIYNPLPKSETNILKTKEEFISDIEAMFETAFTKVGFGGKTAIGYGRLKKVEG